MYYVFVFVCMYSLCVYIVFMCSLCVYKGNFEIGNKK